MSILAQVFEEDGALDRLEAFTSLNGAGLLRHGPERGPIRADPKGDAAAYPTKINPVAGDETVTVFELSRLPALAYWHFVEEGPHDPCPFPRARKSPA
jgi:dihydroorotase